MERAVNENSLQALSAHLESLQRRLSLQSKPASLPFYLRSKGKDNPFRLIKVPLHIERDTKSFVCNILRSCNLETSYVENITSEPPSPQHSTYNNNNSNNYQQPRAGIKYTVDDNDGQFTEEFDLFHLKLRQSRADETLLKFVKKNIDIATIRTKALEDLREDIQKLKHELEEKLHLKEIIYNCGWNFEHFRGCLKSLEKLHDLYAEDLSYLRNKNVIFSQFTGVSLDGDIHLFTGDVQSNWRDVKLLFTLDFQLRISLAYFFKTLFLANQKYTKTRNSSLVDTYVRKHPLASVEIN